MCRPSQKLIELTQRNSSMESGYISPSILKGPSFKSKSVKCAVANKHKKQAGSAQGNKQNKKKGNTVQMTVREQLSITAMYYLLD